MVELILIALGLYGAVRVAQGLLQAMPERVVQSSEPTHPARSGADQEAILSRHSAALTLGATPLRPNCSTVRLVIGTHTGPICADVEGLTEGGVSGVPERPLPEEGADWRLGYLEVGGERYLDLVMAQVPSALGHDAHVVLSFLELSQADENALARLIGAFTPQRLAA